MKNGKKILAVMVAALLLMGMLSAGVTVNAAKATNYIINGDFGTDDTQDWKPDNWTASAGIDAYTWVTGDKTLKIQATGETAEGTVSQDVTGIAGGRLPDGIYTLKAMVKGDPAAISSLALYAQNTGGVDITGDNLSGEITSDFTTVRLEDIHVTAGGCTVGIAVGLNDGPDEWAWALEIDDVSLVKTGEINYAVNGDFGTDATGDWKPDDWTASGEIDSHVWLTGEKTLKIQATGEPVDGTVSQEVTGLDGGDLPEGVYTLEAKVKGDPGAIDSLKLYAQDTGDGYVDAYNVSQEITASDFTVIWLEDIRVTAGACTIGISLSLNDTLANWDWAMEIDDVAFYRTRSLDEEVPTIESVEAPEGLTTVVNQVPDLPGTLTAEFSDGNVSDTEVTWTDPDPALYTGASTIGTSFTVQGTVRDEAAGIDIPVEADVEVTCKSFDLNGDEAINVGDLAIAAYNYGSSSEDGGWGAAAASDVNGDGRVDVSDLQFISNGILDE